MRRSRSTFIILLVLPVVACAEGDGWTGTVTDSAGITIVENTGVGLWTDADRPTIETELDIGTAEGAPEYQLAQVVGIDVSESGDIYVLDMQARRVRVFDADGRFLREMGGSGSGPGELSQMTTGVMLAPGDTVVVPDMMQQRLTRYTSAGEPVGSSPIPMSEGVSMRWEMAPGYRMIQQSRRMALPGMDSVTPGDFLIERLPDGTIRDTILELPTGGTIDLGGDRPRIRLFSAEPMWAAGTDGRIYYAVNDGYSILIHSADGTLESIVRRPFERRPVTDADQQAIRDAMADLYRNQGLPPAAFEQLLGMMEFADFYPAFASILGGPGGSIWVQQIRTADEVAAAGGEIDIQDTGSNRFDVFDRDGRYLGVLELAERFTPMRVRGSCVYGVQRDEMDVQHVQRLSVQPLGRTVPVEGN